MTLYFATIFDINYLSRGMVLFETLKKHHVEFVLYIVCLDDATKNYFLNQNYPEIKLIELSEIESEYKELENAKNNRSRTEYIFTLSPYYPSYILKKNPELPFICTLDADQYFLASCIFVFEELHSHSVLIMPHRFVPNLAHWNGFGKYNVSFQIFKNNKIGNDCLSLWRKQCLEWCHDYLEGGKYADQKYLDTWQDYFGNEVKEIDNIGIGLAPWNVGDKKIEKKSGQVFVNDTPLVLYHYQGLRFVRDKVAYANMELYQVYLMPNLKQLVLKKIIRDLSCLQKGNDKISRGGVTVNGSIFNIVKGYGFFYVIGRIVVSLDWLFVLKTTKRKIFKIWRN